MKFSTLLISVLMGGLFIFSIMSFTYYYSMNNNPNSDLIKNSAFNKTFYNLNQTLNESQSIAEEQLNSTTSDNAILGTDSIIFLSIIGAQRTFNGMIKGVMNILGTFVYEVLGINYIVIGILFTVLLIIIIFSAWRLYKQGE